MTNVDPGAAVAPMAATPATGTGNSTGTNNLTVTAASGTIAIGSAVTGTGVPANTTVAGQISGTPGGNGVYRTNNVTTLSAVALTFTPAAAPIGPLKTGNIGVDDAKNVWAITAAGPVFVAALAGVQPMAVQPETPPPD
jgi:hypothetical protein